MNVIDNVRRAFRSKYFFDIQPTWLQPCLAWLRDQYQLPELTNNYSLEKIYNQWLHTDISLIADACCLPNDLDLNAKKVQLSGKYALQINSILCISEPYYTQVMDIQGDQNDNERIDTDITETQQWKPPPTKRVLYLQLTDGKTILRGLEYGLINGLDRDKTLPGAKILVSGPVLFRRGMLLLTSKNTQVLGGYVEDLLTKNASIETTLNALSKTASKLEESRNRFNRLNFKVHAQAIHDEPINSVPGARTNQNNFHEDEDEMDELIRQAYADGMLNDDSQIVAEVYGYNSSPLSHNTAQPSTTTTTITNQISTSIHQQEEVIVVSDDEDDKRSVQKKLPPLLPPVLSSSSSSLPYEQTSIRTHTPVVTPVTKPLVNKISLPYTYLSLIRHIKLPFNTNYQDHLIKACFSTLASNPRLVKNEFDLQAYVTDGSDCLLIRIASDIIAQHIGLTAAELLAKRNECKNDVERQRMQKDFNERLKQFGNDMQRIYNQMTIRFFSDNTMPTVIKIDKN